MFGNKITHKVMNRLFMKFSIKVDNGPRNRSSNFGDVVHGYKYGNLIEMKANLIKGPCELTWSKGHKINR